MSTHATIVDDSSNDEPSVCNPDESFSPSVSQAATAPAASTTAQVEDTKLPMRERSVSSPPSPPASLRKARKEESANVSYAAPTETITQSDKASDQDWASLAEATDETTPNAPFKLDEAPSSSRTSTGLLDPKTPDFQPMGKHPFPGASSQPPASMKSIQNQGNAARLSSRSGFVAVHSGSDTMGSTQFKPQPSAGEEFAPSHRVASDVRSNSPQECLSNVLNKDPSILAAGMGGERRVSPDLVPKTSTKSKLSSDSLSSLIDQDPGILAAGLDGEMRISPERRVRSPRTTEETPIPVQQPQNVTGTAIPTPTYSYPVVGNPSLPPAIGRNFASYNYGEPHANMMMPTPPQEFTNFPRAGEAPPYRHDESQTFYPTDNRPLPPGFERQLPRNYGGTMPRSNKRGHKDKFSVPSYPAAAMHPAPPVNPLGHMPLPPPLDPNFTGVPYAYPINQHPGTAPIPFMPASNQPYHQDRHSPEDRTMLPLAGNTFAPVHQDRQVSVQGKNNPQKAFTDDARRLSMAEGSVQTDLYESSPSAAASFAQKEDKLSQRGISSSGGPEPTQTSERSAELSDADITSPESSRAPMPQAPSDSICLPKRDQRHSMSKPEGSRNTQRPLHKDLGYSQDRSLDPKKLYICGKSLDDHTIALMCSPFKPAFIGPIIKRKFKYYSHDDNSQYCFVGFHTAEQAKVAHDTLRGRPIKKGTHPAKVAYAFVQTPEELAALSRRAAYRKTVDGLRQWADKHSNMLSAAPGAATPKSDSKPDLPDTHHGDFKRDEPTKAAAKQSYADASRQGSASTKSPTRSSKSSNMAKTSPDAKGTVQSERTSGDGSMEKVVQSKATDSSKPSNTTKATDAKGTIQSEKTSGGGTMEKVAQSKAADAVSTAQMHPAKVGNALKPKKSSEPQVSTHENLPKAVTPMSSTEAANSQIEKTSNVSQATEGKTNTQPEITLPAQVVGEPLVSHKEKTKTLPAKTSSSANESIAAQTLMATAAAGETPGADHDAAKKLTDSPSSGTLLGDEDVPTLSPIPEPVSGPSISPAAKDDAAQSSAPTAKSDIGKGAANPGQAGPSTEATSQNAPAAGDTSLTKKSKKKKSKSKKKAGQPEREEAKPEPSPAELASWIESGTPSPKPKQSKSKQEQPPKSTPEQSKSKREQSKSTLEKSKQEQSQLKSTLEQSTHKQEQLKSTLEKLERQQEQLDSAPEHSKQKPKHLKSTPEQSKQKQASVEDLPSVPTTPVSDPKGKKSQQDLEDKIADLEEKRAEVVKMSLVEEKHRKEGNTFQDINEIIALRPHSPRRVNGRSKRDLADLYFNSDQRPLPPTQTPPPPTPDPSNAGTIEELVRGYYYQKDASYSPLRNRAMDEDEKSDDLKEDQVPVVDLGSDSSSSFLSMEDITAKYRPARPGLNTGSSDEKKSKKTGKQKQASSEGTAGPSVSKSTSQQSMPVSDGESHDKPPSYSSLFKTDPKGKGKEVANTPADSPKSPEESESSASENEKTGDDWTHPKSASKSTRPSSKTKKLQADNANPPNPFKLLTEPFSPPSASPQKTTTSTATSSPALYTPGTGTETHNSTKPSPSTKDTAKPKPGSTSQPSGSPSQTPLPRARARAPPAGGNRDPAPAPSPPPTLQTGTLPSP